MGEDAEGADTGIHARGLEEYTIMFDGAGRDVLRGVCCRSRERDAREHLAERAMGCGLSACPNGNRRTQGDEAMTPMERSRADGMIALAFCFGFGFGLISGMMLYIKMTQP